MPSGSGYNKIIIQYTVINNSKDTILFTNNWKKKGEFKENGKLYYIDLKPYINSAHAFVIPDKREDPIFTIRIKKAEAIKHLLYPCNNDLFKKLKPEIMLELESYFSFDLHVINPFSQIEIEDSYLVNSKFNNLKNIQISKDQSFNFKFYYFEDNSEYEIKNCTLIE